MAAECSGQIPAGRCYLYLDTGLRAGDALDLEWNDVHFEPLKGAQFGFVHVNKGKSKNAKRDLSITKRIRERMEKRFQEHKTDWVFPARWAHQCWPVSSIIFTQRSEKS